MGKIFYIIGKSASGKDKLFSRLMEMPELGLKKMILYTTRPIRAGEQDGREYFFVKEDRLRELRKEGRIIEERQYHTVQGLWTYFTADDGHIDPGKENYLGVGVLTSYLSLRDYYGKDLVCPIYVEVEDGERLIRAIHREKKEEHPKYEEMCRRFLADQEDFSEEKIRDAGIGRRFQNIDFESCLMEIRDYILGFSLKDMP